jgi:hypothetical protein
MFQNKIQKAPFWTFFMGNYKDILDICHSATSASALLHLDGCRAYHWLTKSWWDFQGASKNKEKKVMIRMLTKKAFLIIVKYNA